MYKYIYIYVWTSSPMVQNHRSHRSHWSIPQLAKFQEEILEEPPDLSQYPLMVDLVKHAGPNWSDLYCGGLRSGKYKLLCLEVPLHFLKDATRKLEMTVWCIRHENEMLGTTLDQMLRVFVHIFPSAGFFTNLDRFSAVHSSGLRKLLPLGITPVLGIEGKG